MTLAAYLSREFTFFHSKVIMLRAVQRKAHGGGGDLTSCLKFKGFRSIVYPYQYLSCSNMAINIVINAC